MDFWYNFLDISINIVMTDQTINVSLNNNFILNIPELPVVSEIAQDVILPTITLSGAEHPNRFVDFTAPGEKITYGELDIGFLLDENIDSYVECWNWINRMSGTDIKEKDRFEYVCDTSLIILNNSKEVVRNIVFKDCWPTSIGAVSYNSSSTGEAISIILTMAFTDMAITPEKNDMTGISKYIYNTDHPGKTKYTVYEN